MILSVCTSPCLDVTVYTDRQGNCIKQQTSTCGGKGLNVAVSAKRLGGETRLLSVMFDQDEQLFRDCLRSEGVEYAFVLEQGKVRENKKFYNGETLIEQNAPATEISKQTAAEILQNIRRFSKDSQVTVLSGSLPKNVPPSFYKQMSQAVDRRSLLILDATGENLRQGLAAGRAIDLVKPNLQELEQTTNTTITDLTALKASCQTLLNAGAKRVLVSLGEQGAFITDGKQYYYAKSEQKALNSTVGAGDALVAAVAMQFEMDSSLKQLLRAGIAAGTAKVTDRLEKESYEKLLAQITVKEI